MELNTNKKTNYRWIVCGFLWVAVAVNYVDRTALSAATPIIMKEFNIDGTEMGRYYHGSFFLGICFVTSSYGIYC